MTFNRIDPGDYILRLIEDKDKNHYWSTGDIFKLIQPEKIYNYKGNINIKKNWTTSIMWMFNTSNVNVLASSRTGNFFLNTFKPFFSQIV